MVFQISTLITVNFCFLRPEKFNGLLQRMLVLEASKLTPEKIMHSKHILARLSVNIQKVLVPGCTLNKRSFLGRFTSSRSMAALPCSYSGSVISSCWAPLDIYMENIMDGRQLPITSTIDKLTGDHHEFLHLSFKYIVVISTFLF